jgi:hypothetical protein
VLLDVLEVLENGCEITADDDLLAGHDDGNCEEADELEAVI